MLHTTLKSPNIETRILMMSAGVLEWTFYDYIPFELFSCFLWFIFSFLYLLVLTNQCSLNEDVKCRLQASRPLMHKIYFWRMFTQNQSYVPLAVGDSLHNSEREEQKKSQILWLPSTSEKFPQKEAVLYRKRVRGILWSYWAMMETSAHDKKIEFRPYA